MTAITGLSIRLLGRADIAFDGATLTTLSSRALPLFTILLLSDGPVTRDAIARLLWRRVDATSALASLRQLLHHLPPPLRAVIHAYRNEMSINNAALAECDVLIVKDWLTKQKSEKSEPSAETLLSIYAGALLASQTFDDFPEFDDWLNDQREHLAAKVREVVLAEVISRRQLCKGEAPKEDIAAALDLAQTWLLRDPIDEAMHGEVMQLQILTGNIRAAETQLELLRRNLATRAGRKPTAAIQTILDNALRHRGAIRGTGLPALATSFVGRQDELAEMARMASDVHCRLITLHGPGGIGKTRLALAFAEETRRHDDEAYFVGLEAAQSAQGFYAAIAAAFGFELSPRSNPKDVLCEALRTFEGLLVLDNFEQLLPAVSVEQNEARDFLPILLRAAPRLKMLVTSRVTLGLQEEWLLELGGLSYALTDNGKQIDSTNDTAVELFTSRARQTYRGFSRNAELPHVLAICRAAEGLPLALELAAAQVGTRPCAEIAQSLLADSAPSGRASNRPERHASVRRVIEQSLAVASAEQVRGFTSLALFQAEFSASLAFAVARVRESTLQELNARALLQHVGEHYKLHPLLREWATVRLARARVLAARIEASYIAEMTRRAIAENARLLGAGSADAMASIPARFNDEMSALQLARKIGDVDSIVHLADALVNTAYARGLVRACIDSWPSVDNTMSAIAICAIRLQHANLLRQLGEYDQALEEYRLASIALMSAPVNERSRGLAFSIHTGRAGALLFQGNYAEILNEYAAAEALCIEGAEVQFVERVRMDSFAGTALMELGEMDRAQTILESRLAEAHTVGASVMVLVLLLNALGGVADYQGKLDRCIEIHRLALSLLQAAGLRFMQSRHFCNLGGALLHTADLKEAEAAFEQAIEIATTYSDRGPLTFSQIGLANAALAQHKLSRAAEAANLARMNATRMGSNTLIAESGALMIRVALEQGDFAYAANLLVDITAETGGNIQGFRKLEIIFCGLKIASATESALRGFSIEPAAQKLLAHPACTDIMQREIQAWLQLSGFPPPARRAKKNAVSAITTDAEVDALVKSVNACLVSVRNQAAVLSKAQCKH